MELILTPALRALWELLQLVWGQLILGEQWLLGNVGLRFRDDGRGLQLEKLKLRAIESGKWTAEEVEQWDNKKLADLIFASGITTADKVDMVSGRGVGMDGIKHRLSEYNGQIKVNCIEKKYCEFEILLPAAA